MRFAALSGLWCWCSVSAAQPPVTPTEQTLLVLDASGSMWGQLEGRSKIEIAREALGQMLDALPAEQELGLVAYGHRQRGDCADIELLHAPAADRAPLRQSAAALTPKGMTPISAAVQFAAEQLKYTEQKATVILISDGEETCKADPCAVGRALESLGIGFTAHVIGFDLQAGPARDQLQCLAQQTGGRYLDASNARELGHALQQVTQAAPPAQATLDGPERVEAATAYVLRWTGPAESSDWIGFVRPDAPPADYDAGDGGTWSHALEPGTLNLRAPSAPGRYVLRYVHTVDGSVLAERTVEVTPATATVGGPAQAMAGDTVTVDARGPYAEDHWIGFAPMDGEAGSYVGTSYGPPDPSGTTRLRLAAPIKPGAYELRYVLKGGAAIVARQPIQVVPARGALTAPPSRAVAGQELSLDFTGPRNSSGGSWIGIVPRGGPTSDYQAYCYLPETGACRFTPPEPGSFDLVYVVEGVKLDRRPLDVE